MNREDEKKIMEGWDYWRQQIASGDRSSAPRDWFESALDCLEEPHRWIPVDERERLPETGQIVIFAAEGYTYWGIYTLYHKLPYWFDLVQKIHIGNVTHWRERPAPPGES